MRKLLAAFLFLVAIGALASAFGQTPPTPHYNGVVFEPQGGTPAGVVNGQCWSQSTGYFCYVAGGVTGPFLTAATGGVSTTGSPASGNLSKFSGAASITSGDLSGDATTSGTLVVSVNSLAHVTNASLPNSGLVNAATTVNGQTCTLGSTCTVTAAAGSVAVGTTTIGSGTTGRVLYDNAGLLGELTNTQLTADINAFSSTLSGAAPSSGGGTTNFLRADGTWAAPAGSGGTVTTTGSPASGNLTAFTGAASISNSNLSGDATTSGTLVVTVGKVDGVTYPSGPSANTVPVVTNAAAGGTVTYETVPNAALANSSMTLAGHSVALGGTQTFACADLSNGATGCSTATGTSGATIPLLNGTNVWSGQQSGSVTSLSAASSTITPDGTNNNYSVTLVHANTPFTLANPSATPVAGTGGQIVVIQSSTGSDLISTWGSDYEAAGGTATLTLSTGANAVDILSYFVRDATHIELSLLKTFSH